MLAYPCWMILPRSATKRLGVPSNDASSWSLVTNPFEMRKSMNGSPSRYRTFALVLAMSGQPWTVNDAGSQIKTCGLMSSGATTPLVGNFAAACTASSVAT